MKRTLLAGFALLLILPFMALTAHANPMIDFTLVNPGGTMTFPLAGGGSGTFLNSGNVQGNQIAIGNMTVSGGTPSDGSYVVSNGFLNFNTLTSTLSVTGDVTVNGVLVSGVLLSGNIGTWSLQFGPGTFTATGVDTKSPALLSALGVPQYTSWQYYAFAIGFDPCCNVMNTLDVNSAQVTNTAVPEPTSLLLFGIGLLGVAVHRARLVRASRK